MTILFLIGALLFFLAIGLPIAFSFLLINLIGAYVFMGGLKGMSLSIQQIYSSLTSFALAPIPLFIFMGELMLHSGMAKRTLDVFDKWIGRLPGRLSLIVITGGALFSTLSGSTIANTAMLGEIMVPGDERSWLQETYDIRPHCGSRRTGHAYSSERPCGRFRKSRTDLRR